MAAGGFSGIVLGLATQSTLANALAGLQLVRPHTPLLEQNALGKPSCALLCAYEAILQSMGHVFKSSL